MRHNPYWHGPPGDSPARWNPGDWNPAWQHKRRFLFFRFARVLGLIALLFLIGLVGLAFLLTRLFGGDGQMTVLVWLAGCGLAVAMPLLAGVVAMRSFRGIANPMARVMAAADAVAEGDLSVRVPEVGPGEFARLARSFNRMVAELQSAEQQRRNLTSDVAHELRTPLHIIQGNLEGILDGVYEPAPEQISLLLDETRQLARLVEDLRVLSLAEAGQLPLVKETVNVGELLADVSTSFSGQMEAAGIELSVQTSEDVSQLLISGDPGRLDQVLSNLLSNALRHTSAGGKIILRAESIPGKARIQVSDNGEGIPLADLPSIFDRFWRGDRSRGRGSGSGSGLGLAIARQLVQAHSGRISVESQPGQGTTFTIEIPEKEN